MKSFKQLIKNTNTNSKSFEKLNLALLSDQSSQFLSKLIHKTGLDSDLNIFVWEAPILQQYLVQNERHNYHIPKVPSRMTRYSSRQFLEEI